MCLKTPLSTSHLAKIMTRAMGRGYHRSLNWANCSGWMVLLLTDCGFCMLDQVMPGGSQMSSAQNQVEREPSREDMFKQEE